MASRGEKLFAQDLSIRPCVGNHNVSRHWVSAPQKTTPRIPLVDSHTIHPYVKPIPIQYVGLAEDERLERLMSPFSKDLCSLLASRTSSPSTSQSLPSISVSTAPPEPAPPHPAIPYTWKDELSQFRGIFANHLRPWLKEEILFLVYVRNTEVVQGLYKTMSFKVMAQNLEIRYKLEKMISGTAQSVVLAQQRMSRLIDLTASQRKPVRDELLLQDAQELGLMSGRAEKLKESLAEAVQKAAMLGDDEYVEYTNGFGAILDMCLQASQHMSRQHMRYVRAVAVLNCEVHARVRGEAAYAEAVAQLVKPAEVDLDHLVTAFQELAPRFRYYKLDKLKRMPILKRR